MMCCSLLMSLRVAAVYQTVMEEERRESQARLTHIQRQVVDSGLIRFRRRGSTCLEIPFQYLSKRKDYRSKEISSWSGLDRSPRHSDGDRLLEADSGLVTGPSFAGLTRSLPWCVCERRRGEGEGRMSFVGVPSKSEVMGWSVNHLADYLRRMKLSGCDKVVIKHSMSGSWFVNMTDNDVQKFPKIHAPMIWKIWSEINKKDERRGLSLFKRPTPKYHEPDTPTEENCWGEDEFEKYSDDEADYEEPDDGGSVGDYESPTEEFEDREGADDNDYEPPPTEHEEDLAHKLCPTLPMGDNSEYIDNRNHHTSGRGLPVPPPAVCPRPPGPSHSTQARQPVEPSPSRRDHSPRRPPGKNTGEPPRVFRDKKPTRDRESNNSPIQGAARTVTTGPGTQPWRPQPEGPDPASWTKPPAPVLTASSSISVVRSNSSARPSPSRFVPDARNEAHDEGPVPRHHTFPLPNKGAPPPAGPPGFPRQGNSLPPSIPPIGSLQHKLAAFSVNRSQSIRTAAASLPPPPPDPQQNKDMDPRWYVGKVTRGQAEGCLRQVKKDGAYLVRDSTRQQSGQPFTLMVLFQDKVFNIQIRHQQHQYLLGTGLKSQEQFPTVSDIIGHYSHSPLLLIDAKNRGSGHQNQCLLSDPAGYWLSGQNWS